MARAEHPTTLFNRVGIAHALMCRHMLAQNTDVGFWSPTTLTRLRPARSRFCPCVGFRQLYRVGVSGVIRRLQYSTGIRVTFCYCVHCERASDSAQLERGRRSEARDAEPSLHGPGLAARRTTRASRRAAVSLQSLSAVSQARFASTSGQRYHAAECRRPLLSTSIAAPCSEN